MTEIRKKGLMIGMAAALFVLIAGGIFAYMNYFSPEAQFDKYMELGQKYLLDEDYEQAIIAFGKAIKIDDKAVDAYFGLADAFVGNGDIDKAESTLTKIIQIDEQQNNAYFKLAELYLKEKSYEEAIDTLLSGYIATGNEDMNAKLDQINKDLEAESNVSEPAAEQETASSYTNSDELAGKILNSKIAGYLGKTEAEIEAVYGPVKNENWFNGFMYADHASFPGAIGYGEPDDAIMQVQSDSICYTIVARLSVWVPNESVTFNKDEMEFVDFSDEGMYYYALKDNDSLIIECDENGTIEADPWIYVFSK